MDELIKLVIEEATALKKHATEEEINNLDFDLLTPQDYRGCIYGQMTGSCFNERATTLIEQCATKVYNNSGYDGIVHENVTLNGSPLDTKRDFYFSPIEVFISKYPNEGANDLIRFLKGESDTLDL